MKTIIELEWEVLLTEMRKACECGVPGIGSREIVTVERKLERIRRNRESMRAAARMFLGNLKREKSQLPPTKNL